MCLIGRWSSSSLSLVFADRGEASLPTLLSLQKAVSPYHGGGGVLQRVAQTSPVFVKLSGADALLRVALPKEAGFQITYMFF